MSTPLLRLSALKILLRIAGRSVEKLALVIIIQIAGTQIDAASAQQRQTGLLFLDEAAYRSIPLASTPLMGGIPTSADMSSSFPTPGNQGTQGSCVGWAVGYALKSYQERVERGWELGSSEHTFSPSFIYNQIKASQDCQGAFIPDALNVMRNGAATLIDFPYDQRTCRQNPDAVVKQSARPFAIAEWRRVNVQDLTEVKTQIAAGFPVVIGAIVDEAFGRLSAGEIYTSPDNIEPAGHAMVVVGYNDDLSALKVINSWGTEWADGGFGWINYDTFRRITREGYVAQDIVVRPPAPPVDTIRVLYFRKEADRGKVEQALNSLGLRYDVAQGTSSVPTSLLTCTPDIPGEKLRAIALALYDSGVRLKRINFALRGLNVRNRISLESTSRSNYLHALTRDDLLNLDACKFVKSELDES